MFERLKNRFRRKKGKRKGRVATIERAGQHYTVRWSGVLFTLGALALVGLLYFLHGLPSLTNLESIKRPPSITVKAANGRIIGSYGDVYGEYIPYKKVPKPLVDAVIATEDRHFFYHFGIDPLGLARATWANFRAGKVVQGGSTITQQVAKNLFLTSNRTFKRKFQEMLIAFYLELRYSKREIMAIYLNRLYLGAGNYGVDAASRRYFGKPAQEVGLPEAAFLAGLLKAPSRYAPSSNPELAGKRAKQVLLNMVDADMITEKQSKKAEESFPTVLKYNVGTGQDAMYFTDWAVEFVPELIGEAEEDIVVKTTLDTELQQLAEQAVATVMDKEGEAKNASQAALVSMTRDGAVKALVGGRNYAESQYNRAFQSKRQPGSSFKPIMYLAALENGFTPESIVVDQPVSYGRWSPQNYAGGYEGEMPLRRAVALSINTVAVQVAMATGLNEVVNMAARLGITSKIHPYGSTALGSDEVSLMELTGAYAHLASNGLEVQPYAITEIRNKKDKLLYERKEPARPRVLSENTVAMMNSMLIGVVEYGTGTRANIGRPMAGKTGTASDYKDAWFIGYVPQMATGVWVGNDNAKPMKKVTGGALPSAIWKAYMSGAVAKLPAQSLPTGYSQGFGSFLPWLNGGSADTNDTPWLNRRDADRMGSAPAPEYRGEPDYSTRPAPQQTEPQSEPRRQGEDESFWSIIEQRQ